MRGKGTFEKEKKIKDGRNKMEKYKMLKAK